MGYSQFITLQRPLEYIILYASNWVAKAARRGVRQKPHSGLGASEICPSHFSKESSTLVLAPLPL